MDAGRRAYWEEVEAENLAAAGNAGLADARRRGSALFAGQAAFLIGRPPGDNPFPAGTMLHRRWAEGWDVGNRRGDPAGRTHADWTHPED